MKNVRGTLIGSASIVVTFVVFIIPFLFIVGFMTVYFLGSKGFCTYGCPYGGVFGIADPHVADLLGAKADPVERVGGSHPALVELVVDDVAGD